jgi:type I restriction-modification system DNA methylase subunit
MTSREKYIQQIIESVSVEKRLDALSQLEKAVTQSPLTDGEKRLLQSYEGMGGKIKQGAQSSAKGGDNPLYEFYTPQYIASAMFDLARKHGYKDSHKVLEPACATGRLIEPVKDPSKVTAFEITEATYRIARLIYPKANIYHQYFETAFMEPPKFRSKLTGKQVTWLKDYPFDMVIGNPPYGKYSGLFASYFLRPRLKQVEHVFIYYGLKLLRKGGLLVFVISQNFMRNGNSYNDAKQLIGQQANLIDAYRLPPVFKNSTVPTDIIILKKK